MLSLNARRLLEFLVSQLQSRAVKPGWPETYLPYGKVHESLGLSMKGDTIGKSLEYQGMRELAEWIYENGYPAITGLIIDRSTFMPARGYFEVYRKTPDDFSWWESEMKKAAEFNWSDVVSLDCTPREITYPDDIPTGIIHKEGAAKSIQVNRYERDSEARLKCIKHYGFDCVVCGMNLKNVYGEIGKNYIHVHHLIPISSIGEEYVVDPVRDLRPVCPNCHSMLHRKNPPYSIEELSSMISEIDPSI